MVGQWKNKFAHRILERGKQYLQEGRVKDITRQGNTIVATVMGNEDYTVALELTDTGVGDMECGCAYAAENSCCKHMAAALYAIESMEMLEQNDPVEMHGTGLRGNSMSPAVRDKQVESSTGLSREPVWKEAIKALPEDVVRQMLVKIVAEDQRLQDGITIQYLGRPPIDMIQSWKKELRNIYYATFEYGRLYHADTAYRYTSALIDFLEERLELLFDAGAIDDAFMLTGMVFETAMSVEMDDSYGGLTELTCCCQEAWEQIIKMASEKQQEVMCAWFWTRRNDNWVYGTDPLDDVFLLLPWHETEHKGNLCKVDEQLEKETEGYRLGKWFRLRAEIMDLLKMPLEEMIIFWKAHQNVSVAREHLLTCYLKSDKHAAIQHLRECKTLDAERKWKVIEHSKALVGLYAELGMNAEYAEELRTLVLDHGYLDIGYIEKLKADVPADEWSQMYAKLWDSAGSEGQKMDLLKVEERYTELLDMIMQQGLLAYFDRYEAELRQSMPEQARDCLADLLTEAMFHASGRKEYRRIAEELKRLVAYPDGEEAAKQTAQYWCSELRRRKAMVEEVHRAGF